MAMATVGSVAPFVEEEEAFIEWRERFEQFLLANNVTDEVRMRAFLITLIGPRTYSRLRDLLAPDRPTDTPYADLLTLLGRHYEPKKIVIAERYKFHLRMQGDNESVVTFMASLRSLAKDCDFGAFLSEALRDRFVCGLRSEAIKRKLLSEADLTDVRALELAQAMEVAAAQTETLHTRISVNRVTANRKEHQGKVARSGKVDSGCSKGKDKGGQDHKLTDICYRCGRGGTVLRTAGLKQQSATSAARQAISKKFADQLKLIW